MTTAEADSPRMRDEAVAETSGATVRAQEDTREVTFEEASEELVVDEDEAEVHMQELEARRTRLENKKEAWVYKKK